MYFLFKHYTTMKVKTLLLLYFLNFILLSDSLRECKRDNRIINYYKIKSCHKSASSVIFWKHVPSLKECKSIARERNGLAFNFSPSEAQNVSKLFLPNCHVLGCPVINNDSSLIMDLAFDYYSAYGNLNYFTLNTTCIKSVGLFSLTSDYQNYSQSVLSCQNASGDLADVTSEYQTIMLSQIIRDNVPDWYKAAYVGLDDIQTEGVFRTSLGKDLTCSNYRGWAPGHPRSKYHQLEGCVSLDSDRLWRVVNCNKVKLRGLCELYPQPPNARDKILRNITCSNILDTQRGKKKKCLVQKELFEIYQNASRMDRCALLNIEENTKL